MDAVKAECGQPVQQRSPVPRGDAVDEVPAVEELVGDGTEGRVTAVLGPENNGLVSLKGEDTDIRAGMELGASWASGTCPCLWWG